MVLLHPALLTLMTLQFRGLLRRGVRGTGTAKGKIFLGVAVVLVVLWLGPAVFSAFVTPRANPDHVRAALPAILTAMALVAAVAHGGDKAVSFTPGEVNFLFPGPFTRRQLLVYKIAKSVAGGLLTSLFLSLALMQYASFWAAGWLGAFLSLMFLQLFSMAVVLLGQTAAEATAARRWRRVVLWAVVGGVAVALAPAARAALQADWPAVLAALNESTAARVALAPVKPLAMAWTAQAYVDLLAWGALAAAVDLALLAVVLRLDANLMEVALEASRRQDAALGRVRRGQILSAANGATSSRLRVPMPPRLGGAGAIVWRQATTALRTAPGLLIFLAIFGVAMVPGALIGGRHGGPWAVLPMIVWVTLILAALLKFDFRADLDRMDALKSLPLPPAVVALGQIATPVIVLAALHVLLLGSLALFAPINNAGGGRAPLLWAAAAAVPFDLLLIGVENLVFLLAPARPAAATPGDLSAMGRNALLFVVKALVLLVPCGVTAVLATAAYFLAGRSPSAAGAVAVVVLSLQALAVVPLVGWAFRRFDPSADTPA